MVELLRAWWREGRRRGVMLPQGWLFPGRNPITPLSTRQMNRAVHAAAEAAEIKKRVTPHTEAFLCHTSAGAGRQHPRHPGPARTCRLNTTALYAHVATKTILTVMSPLDRIRLLPEDETRADG